MSSLLFGSASLAAAAAGSASSSAPALPLEKLREIHNTPFFFQANESKYISQSWQSDGNFDTGIF
jgi:hypothetical protein